MADADKKPHRHWIEISQVVAMPIVTLVVGYLLNSSISTSQTRDSNLRLYADMMGRREEADSALRKDMFKSILDTFVSSSPGAKGEPPTHSQLLDHLAVELRQGGWSMKHTLRQIVTSQTYQQSSRVAADKLAADPDNLYLSRAPRYRMPAEMLRDNALSVSGLLADKMFGPPVFPPLQAT